MIGSEADCHRTDQECQLVLSCTSEFGPLVSLHSSSDFFALGQFYL